MSTGYSRCCTSNAQPITQLPKWSVRVKLTNTKRNQCFAYHTQWLYRRIAVDFDENIDLYTVAQGKSGSAWKEEEGS